MSDYTSVMAKPCALKKRGQRITRPTNATMCTKKKVKQTLYSKNPTHPSIVDPPEFFPSVKQLLSTDHLPAHHYRPHHPKGHSANAGYLTCSDRERTRAQEESLPTFYMHELKAGFAYKSHYMNAYECILDTLYRGRAFSEKSPCT